MEVFVRKENQCLSKCCIYVHDIYIIYICVCVYIYVCIYIFKALRAVRRARFGDYAVLCSFVFRWLAVLELCIIFDTLLRPWSVFWSHFAISSSFWQLFDNILCIKNSIGAPRLPQVAPRCKMQI